MKSTIVLMYHALWDDDKSYADLTAVDRPFAIQAREFDKQMARIVELGIQDRVHVTFDDGHDSALKIAMPIMSRHDLVASLYVTTEWMNNRKHFCSKHDLEVLRDAGWTIGGHGNTHRFLTTINEDDLDEELRVSREQLEPLLGERPSMSFPGGCYSAREIDAAHANGFVDLFSSRAVWWDTGKDAVHPRYVMRRNTTFKTFDSVITASASAIIATAISHGARSAVRLVLGDDLYYSVYRFLRS